MWAEKKCVTKPTGHLRLLGMSSLKRTVQLMENHPFRKRINNLKKNYLKNGRSVILVFSEKNSEGFILPLYLYHNS